MVLGSHVPRLFDDTARVVQAWPHATAPHKPGGAIVERVEPTQTNTPTTSARVENPRANLLWLGVDPSFPQVISRETGENPRADASRKPRLVARGWVACYVFGNRKKLAHSGRHVCRIAEKISTCLSIVKYQVQLFQRFCEYSWI